jgi:hypothetical protein
LNLPVLLKKINCETENSFGDPPLKWSILKVNPERVAENPQQLSLVQNFMGDLMAHKPDFYLPPFGRYTGMKTGKIGNFRIRPSRVHRLSQPIGRIKKI